MPRAQMMFLSPFLFSHQVRGMKNVRVLFKPSRFRNTVESILRQRRERPPALARPEDVLNASLQASVSVLAIWLPLRYSLEVEKLCVSFRLLRKD